MTVAWNSSCCCLCSLRILISAFSSLMSLFISATLATAILCGSLSCRILALYGVLRHVSITLFTCPFTKAWEDEQIHKTFKASIRLLINDRLRLRVSSRQSRGVQRDHLSILRASTLNFARELPRWDVVYYYFGFSPGHVKATTIRTRADW